MIIWDTFRNLITFGYTHGGSYTLMEEAIFSKAAYIKYKCYSPVKTWLFMYVRVV